MPLAPVERDSALAWTHATLPRTTTAIRFRWRYEDERVKYAGRGSARIAPPDSARLDVSAALGVASGAGVVVDDTMVWGRPEDLLARFVPNYDLMWAMFGVARVPPPGATITGAERAGERAWRYAHGGDTLIYRLTSGDPALLEAEVRRGSDVIGRVETRLGSAGLPTSTRLVVPSGPARLDITFENIESVAPFPPDLWVPGQP